MSQIICNVVAERSSTNDGCVDITFDVKNTENIIAYEVYSVSDSGQKKRTSFPITESTITMQNLAKDMGYMFEVQAVYSKDSFSLAAQSNHVDGVETSRNYKKKDVQEDIGEDNNPAKEGPIKSSAINCYYKIGDQIKDGKPVYKGQFSYVFSKFEGPVHSEYKGQCPLDEIPPRKVAVKVLSASDYELWGGRKGDGQLLLQKTKKMVREAKHMFELIEHENVVKYIHSCPEDSESTLFYIFMELCSEKTLADRISKLDEHCEFNDRTYCKAIIRHLALAVHYMHEQGICHRDIKPSNILFTEGEGVVKISDFGFSKKLCNGDFSSTSNIGTSGYCPPESFADSGIVQVSDRGDVFSLGLVYFYILTKGKHPFRNVPTEGKGPESQQQQNNICDLDKMPILEGLTGRDAALAKDLIKKMIMKNERQRLEMDEVMKHAYFWDAEQLIGFYILVHDSLSKTSQMRLANSEEWRQQSTL